jgi:hypothetical protein
MTLKLYANLLIKEEKKDEMPLLHRFGQ